MAYAQARLPASGNIDQAGFKARRLTAPIKRCKRAGKLPRHSDGLGKQGPLLVRFQGSDKFSRLLDTQIPRYNAVNGSKLAVQKRADSRAVKQLAAETNSPVKVGGLR